MLKKLLIIALYVVCIVSCTQEIIIYNPVDDDKEVTYTEGNLSVYLEGMGTVTRSTWIYDDYFSSSDILHDDTKHERGFFNRLLVSFDSNFLLEYYSRPTYGVNDSFTPPAIDNLTSTNSEYTGVPLGLNAEAPLTTGAHYFYVLCNLPQEVHAYFTEVFNNGQGTFTKDQLEQTVLKYPLDVLAQKFDGWDGPNQQHNTQRCMMTNIVSPAPDYMASKDQNFQGQGYPSTNNVKSHIGKIFAKASLAYIEENQKLTNVTYRVVNVPKSVYLMPNIFNKQVETPHFTIDFQDRNSYDPNYNEWFDEKYKLETDEPDWQKAVVSTSQEKTYVYCMENGNTTPLQGNSTFLLVRATYHPAEWVNRDGTPGPASGDNSFWRIKRGGVYTSYYYNEEPDPSEVGSGTPVRYPEGITYYPIWLQTDGLYQVRRNGFYKIVLTRVLSAGAPTVDSVIDPLAPIENTTTRSSLIESGSSNIPEINQCIEWQQAGI